jgi:hypothetical protein
MRTDSKISSTMNSHCSSSAQCSRTLCNKPNASVFHDNVPADNQRRDRKRKARELPTHQSNLIYLYDTTTIRMHGKCCNFTTEGWEYESNFFCWNTLNALLYDMITVLITYTFHNMSIQFKDKLCFLIKLNYIKCLRNITGSKSMSIPI